MPVSRNKKHIIKYKSDYEDMAQHINGYPKESERRAADSKQSNVDFEDVLNITADSDSVIP